MRASNIPSYTCSLFDNMFKPVQQVCVAILVLTVVLVVNVVEINKVKLLYIPNMLFLLSFLFTFLAFELFFSGKK